LGKGGTGQVYRVEQCPGSQVDYHSDIYSLGCAIFETLTGRAPFTGNNAMATLMMHLAEPSPTLAEASGGKRFPNELEYIVAQMLAKELEERYQSLEIVAQDLVSIINDFEKMPIYCKAHARARCQPCAVSTDLNTRGQKDIPAELHKYLHYVTRTNQRLD